MRVVVSGADGSRAPVHRRSPCGERAGDASYFFAALRAAFFGAAFLATFLTAFFTAFLAGAFWRRLSFAGAFFAGAFLAAAAFFGAAFFTAFLAAFFAGAAFFAAFHGFLAAFFAGLPETLAFTVSCGGAALALASPTALPALDLRALAAAFFARLCRRLW